MNIHKRGSSFFIGVMLAFTGMMPSCSSDCQKCDQRGSEQSCQNGCECDKQPEKEEKTGEDEITDNGDFDITGGHLLSENIVKYYDPEDGQLQPVRSVTILDFTTKEFNFSTTTEFTKNYSRSYKFDYAKEYVIFSVPTDFSAYSVLAFSVYVPESAVGQSVYVQIPSENPDFDGEDYYGQLVEFKKSGWNDVEIELAGMKAERKPLGFDHVDMIIFETRSYGQSNSKDTTIYLENLVLRTDPAKELAADVVRTVLDFADSRYAAHAVTEYVKTGTKAYKWEYTDEMVDVYFTEKLSANEALSFWVYVPEEAVNETFYLQFISQNTDFEGDDYYGYLVKLTQSGWNKYTIRLNECEVDRNPKGWDNIDYLLLTRVGFDQVNKESTVIYLNNFESHTKIDDNVGNTIPKLAGAAFSLNGSRAIVDGVLINNNYDNDKATVYRKNGEYWLPLVVFGARYDSAALYQAKTHSLQMALNGRKYQFKGGKNSVNIDGQDTALDFTVASKGGALFAPAHYIKTLLGYSEEYLDEMGMIYLSKEPYEFKSFPGRLNIMFETLFLRPNGAEIAARIKEHFKGDVHPRIMLTQADFDRLKSMIGEDETYTSYYNYMLMRYGTESNEFKKEPVKYDIYDGVRLLEISRTARNRIIPWALLYKLTGQVAYVTRIWEEVEALINFPDWHPEHYLDTAEILYPMAIAFDWLYDAWSPEQRDIMAEKVVTFGLNSGLDRYEGRIRKWGNDNWNGVCNGGLTAAALAYLFHPKAKAAAQKVLDYSIRDVELGMEMYAPDGGYLESTGYWAYGTDYLHVMFSALKSATGTAYGLYNAPGFAHSAYFTTYFENDAGAWGFHDAKPEQSDTWTHYWFARESADPSLGRLRYNAIESKLKGIHFYDAMYYAPELVGELPKLNLDAYYSAIETLTMRDHWENGSTLVGIHAGYNGQSHGDRDVGNFVIFGAGKQFITELGVEDYNLPDYDLRYRKSAEGQNTLVIGDVDAGKHLQDPQARTQIVRHEFGRDSALAVVDMQPAYTQYVEKAERGLLFKDQRSTIIIQDEITLKEPQIVRWAAHTTGTIEIAADGRSATISMEGADKVLYAEIVSADSSLEFTSGKAVSYDPDYSSKLSYTDKENDRSDYSKLMIVTPDKVSTFNNAVMFKFVDKAGALPHAGQNYKWTAIDDWHL